MGRVLILVLIVVAIYLVWKACGPQSWNRSQSAETPMIKGPDDDEEFLWELEKKHFKEMRARQKAEEERRREGKHGPEPTDSGETN